MLITTKMVKIVRNIFGSPRTITRLCIMALFGSSMHGNATTTECSYKDLDTKWGQSKEVYTPSYCYINEQIDDVADPTIIDNGKSITQHLPISETGIFEYRDILERNVNSESLYKNHQFGSINNGILPTTTGSTAFHTGLDLYAKITGFVGAEKPIKAAFSGRIIWAGKHNDLSGYSMVVYSRLKYPITIDKFHWKYAAEFNGGNFVTGAQKTAVDEFAIHYLHLDRCQQENSSKIAHNLIGNLVTSGDKIARTYGQSSNYTTCSSIKTEAGADPSDPNTAFGPHLHMEVLLPQTDENNHRKKSFLNASGYDSSSQANARVNQYYADPEVFFAKIEQRNLLLRNLARSEHYCPDNQSCMIDHLITEGHMHMAQHFLGNAAVLGGGVLPATDATPTDTCYGTTDLCDYTIYRYNNKRFIIAGNLNVVHTDIAPYWDRNKDGLPLTAAVVSGGVVRQNFQYSLTSLSNTILTRAANHYKVITPRLTAWANTVEFSNNDKTYWSTNSPNNVMFFQLGEAGIDFESVERLSFSIPNENKKVHLNASGDDFTPATNKSYIALYSKVKGASDTAYVQDTNAAFQCVGDSNCFFAPNAVELNAVVIDQGSLSGEVTLALSARYEQGKLYAIGFKPQSNTQNSTKGVSISEIRANLISPATNTSDTGSLEQSYKFYLCSKNIIACVAQ